MLRLDKVIKPWKESAALNDHINLYGFWNETAFLTKSGDLGMILSVPGVDYESLDRSEQEYAVKRLEAALKAFGTGFHVYQYLFKSNRPDIPFATYDDPIVQAAIDQRRKFFEAKRDHLYQIEIFYCVLLEGSRSKTGVGTALARLFHDPEGAIVELKSQFTNDNMKTLLRAHIERDVARLDQHVQAFARQLADFMQIEVSNQRGQFRFFRRLLNYDDWRVAGAPQSTQFLDYQVVNSDIEAERDHLRVGDHIVRVLTMKEAITETRPLVLDALLKIPANFYVVTEWTPLPADKARKEVNKRRRHFNMSKTGFVSQMGNDATKTNPRDVLVDESKQADIENLGDCLRALGEGQSLGYFSLTIVLYGRSRADIDQLVAEFTGVFTNADGNLFVETYNQLNAYFATVPGNYAINLRKLYMLNTNYADLSFLFTILPGEKTNEHLGTEYWAVLETDNSTPYFLNLHNQRHMRGEKIMPSTQNAVNNHEYRSVPITALAESATNPRKRFDPKSLEELAASFKTQGILAPLLVRELEEAKYEVVAGARRLRAAKLAELEKLPVRVVKLTDAEAIEAQCVENLQREDIHPLEEALGFKSLLELGEPAYSIATIASRAGKSEAYIYGRTRLADLIPPVAEAFLKDQITIGHALLIAKLPASQQQEAFSAAFRGLWTSEGNSQILIPVRELAAWIESNILLQLASAPFDKQDETLVPEAGSCGNCPKRTGFNKLLFPDVRKDSCTSPDCFRAKIDACVKNTLETKPQLIQISAAWNSREGAPLGRNRYRELEIKKPKANGTSSKLAANEMPCEKMAEAIVMDGGKRGQVVKVCADPACRVHHPNTPSPQQVERERAEERKRIEKEKLAITTRHRILATILQRVSTPLKKADLLAVAHYLIGHLSYSQVPALAKRHKIEAKKDSASAQEILAKQVSKYDESELCKLLLEISLLDSAYQRSTASRDDVLLDAAKRYRVDAEKVQKTVAGEYDVKRNKSKPRSKRNPVT